MHLVIVVLTMLALPLVSILIELRASVGGPGLWPLIGKWFVFWGVGIRLAIAGGRQIIRPELTATGIFGVTDKAAFPLAQELGFWNLAIGVVAIATLKWPDWLVPVALAAALFYGMAGALHVASGDRNFAASTAMISDLGIAALLAAFVVVTLSGGR